jgi:hypothetical protein
MGGNGPRAQKLKHNLKNPLKETTLNAEYMNAYVFSESSYITT